MRRLAKSLEIAAILLVLAICVLGVIWELAPRSWPAAQLHAAVALSVTERTPVLDWAVRTATPAPRVAQAVVGGAPSTVVRPATGDGPWPAVVFVNGATRRGRFHPKVQRLARGLARAGFLVVVPDLPGLRLGQITPATTDAAVRVAEATAARPDAHGHRIGFYGVSVGASLALLAAERPVLAGQVTVVGGEAPWTDMRRIIELATTGLYDGRPYMTDPYASLAIARSLAAGLSARSRLLARLDAEPDHAAHPLAGLLPSDYRGGARAVVALLVNHSPDRFDELYAKLPDRVRRSVRALSPLLFADRLRVPVELASAPHDKYFPPAESRALARVDPRAHLTVTATLQHAIPHPSVGDLRDLFRFDGFIVRFLQLAEG